jgi:hypothetical protein
MALESQDLATLRHIALCYMEAFVQAVNVIALPTRRTVNWREEIPD